jgi:hypothetical protein
MTADRWDFTRQTEETYAEILAVTLTADHVATLGYASAAAAATGLAQADVRLVVPSLGESIAATVTAVVSDGGVVMTLSWAPSVAMTDTAQHRACYVVHEPGSPTSERLLCSGFWIVTTRVTTP